VEESCEHTEEPLGSIKFREMPDYLSNHQFLKTDSAPWL